MAYGDPFTIIYVYNKKLDLLEIKNDKSSV